SREQPRYGIYTTTWDSNLRLASGAGHDAMHVARIAPMGMLFIPCREGLSHCPEEWADPADIARGAEVLARALQLLDERLR
ncbi:MAG: M20/M25/M40 family metallo-hydrolase, partial [Bacillota bacterium]